MEKKPEKARKGDQGKTALLDGERISKGEIIFEIIGTLDEASAYLGLAISFCNDLGLKSSLQLIQDQLSKIMGMFACSKKGELSDVSFLFDAVQWMEEEMETYAASIDKPRGFVFPGKSSSGAAIDIARTVVRRAERITVRNCDLNKCDEKEIISYLNRLSSLLFTLRLFSDFSQI